MNKAFSPECVAVLCPLSTCRIGKTTSEVLKRSKCESWSLVVENPS
jgi:hypothetical protein